MFLSDCVQYTVAEHSIAFTQEVTMTPSHLVVTPLTNDTLDMLIEDCPCSSDGSVWSLEHGTEYDVIPSQRGFC